MPLRRIVGYSMAVEGLRLAAFLTPSAFACGFAYVDIIAQTAVVPTKNFGAPGFCTWLPVRRWRFPVSTRTCTNTPDPSAKIWRYLLSCRPINIANPPVYAEMIDRRQQQPHFVSDSHASTAFRVPCLHWGRGD